MMSVVVIVMAIKVRYTEAFAYYFANLTFWAPIALPTYTVAAIYIPNAKHVKSGAATRMTSMVA